MLGDDLPPAPGRRTLTWRAFLDEVLPKLFRRCGVGPEQSAAVVTDIERRATDYAAGGRSSRRMLRVPFLDDVADFEPREAPLGVKADIAVVVRNSLLEDVHSHGPIDDPELLDITYTGTGAFNAWLNSNANPNDHDPPKGVFAATADCVRASAGLQALALAAENGGRRSFRTPKAPPPVTPWTADGGAVDDPVWADGRIERSALAAVDSHLVGMLDSVAEGSAGLLVTSSLSRYSRDSVLLAQIVEFLLAHKATILTTNLMLRPGEAFARRPPFVAADSQNTLVGINAERLSGIHAKVLNQVIAELGPST